MQMLLAWCIYHTSKTLAEMRPELTEIAERGFPTGVKEKKAIPESFSAILPDIPQLLKER